MNRSRSQHKPKSGFKNTKSKTAAPKTAEAAEPPSRFAASAFLSGSPETIQGLCDEIARLAAKQFSDLTGTSWARVAESIVQQLRASGHDLSNFDEADGFQEWQTQLHHPRGTFSLFLSFRAPSSVEVSWTANDVTFVGRA